MLAIDVTETPAAEDLRVIGSGLSAYNQRRNPGPRSKLCLFLRDGRGFVVGGLSGEIVGAEFYIAWLWIAEEHRGEGEGARLLSEAETEAMRRGCTRATVDTYAFQAPDFYRKQGYGEIGRIEDYSQGHARHWFRKELL